MSNSLNVIQDKEPWYSKGLRFKCTECGQCCTGAPGYVWISESDILNISEHLNLSVNEFKKKYLRFVKGRYALHEDPKTFDCIFLKNKKCEIYSVRPIQCRTFPWWQENLKTPEDWKEAAKYCEGISEEAPLVPYETIQKQKLEVL